MATKYVVTAPYVTLQTATADGVRLVGMYAGTPVPDDVPEASIQHHLEAGLIAPVEEAEAQLEAQPGEITTPTGSEPGSLVPGEAVEQPAGNASLEDWQAYARSQGATDAQLEGKSRNDLRDSYGS